MNRPAVLAFLNDNVKDMHLFQQETRVCLDDSRSGTMLLANFATDYLLHHVEEKAKHKLTLT